MLIRNYGLLWKFEHIDWGGPGRPGHMKGVLATNKKSTPVDFRDQQGVYVLYDDWNSNQILYVGQAGAGNQRLFERLRDHRNDNLDDRCTKFSWFGIRKVLKSGDLGREADNKATGPKSILNHVEAILIHAVDPPKNRQGGRFGNDVGKFLQYHNTQGNRKRKP